MVASQEIEPLLLVDGFLPMFGLTESPTASHLRRLPKNGQGHLVTLGEGEKPLCVILEGKIRETVWAVGCERGKDRQVGCS